MNNSLNANRAERSLGWKDGGKPEERAQRGEARKQVMAPTNQDSDATEQLTTPLHKPHVLRRDGKESKGGAGNQKLFNYAQTQPESINYTPESIPASITALIYL